jgi:tetratricopeptide (TPR) repeat protein
MRSPTRRWEALAVLVLGCTRPEPTSSGPPTTATSSGLAPAPSPLPEPTLPDATEMSDLDDDRIPAGHVFFADLFWQRHDTREGRLCYKRQLAARHAAGAGDLARAESLLVEAVQLARSFDVGSPIHRNMLRTLAEVQAKAGAWARAASTNEQLRALAVAAGPATAAADTTAARLATSYRKLGRLDEAEAAFRAVLAGVEASHGAEHPAGVDALYGLASIARARGQRPEADVFMRRALRAYGAELASIRAQEWVLDPEAREVLGGLLSEVAPRPGDRRSFPGRAPSGGYAPVDGLDYDALVQRWWQRPQP